MIACLRRVNGKRGPKGVATRDILAGCQPRFTRLKGIRAAERRFGERISYTEKGHERIPLACYGVTKTKNATPSLLAGG